MTPIICPTKGRADRKMAKTLVLFEDAPEALRARFKAYVEPQDEAAYRAAFPKLNFFVLPWDNPGLPKVRDLALDFHRLKGPFWMLDDDISYFGISNGKKVERQPADVIFSNAEKLLDHAQKLLGTRVLGQAAMEYQQFSWSQTKPYAWRSYCDVAVWINAPKIHGSIHYDAICLKEDRDFTLQVLASGCETLRLRQVAFAAPKNGSNAGGLQDLYKAAGREEKSVEEMVKKWPGLVTKQVKPDGRIDCKINWKTAFGYCKK